LAFHREDETPSRIVDTVSQVLLKARQLGGAADKRFPTTLAVDLLEGRF
jgi:hypothetical protein